MDIKQIVEMEMAMKRQLELEKTTATDIENTYNSFAKLDGGKKVIDTNSEYAGFYKQITEKAKGYGLSDNEIKGLEELLNITWKSGDAKNRINSKEKSEIKDYILKSAFYGNSTA